MVELEGVGREILWTARSPDDRYLALGNQLWTCVTGASKTLGKIFDSTALFTPDSRFLAINMCEGSRHDDAQVCGVAIWDLESMTHRLLHKGVDRMFGGGATEMRLVAANRLLLDGLGLYDTARGAFVWKSPSNFDDVSPDGQLVAASFEAVSEREHVRVLRMSDGVEVFSHPESYFFSWWIGDHFITRDSRNHMHVFRRSDWKEVAVLPDARMLGSAWGGRALIVDDGGRLGVAGLSDGTLRHRFYTADGAFVTYDSKGRFYASSEAVLRDAVHLREPGDVRYAAMKEVPADHPARQLEDLLDGLGAE